MLAAAEKTAVLTPWNTSDPVAGAIYSALCERHGKKVQEKLDAGFVTICGLGGLGSNIAVSLARIGVGHLRLVDFVLFCGARGRQKNGRPQRIPHEDQSFPYL